ncbi:hypothetical protein [Chromobacterium haemolyticum]|uniref:hypothetical protein n=1 Tax=Chromobacterium haemolyticum TaxID=394935 RepID=UPI0012FAF300|nr:hypothetical protein [Chromobacterium haemolyticum]
MEKCRHGLDIEKSCSRCVGDAMQTMPAISPSHKRMISLANGIVNPDNQHGLCDKIIDDDEMRGNQEAS